jgi:hypothetical protein
MRRYRSAKFGHHASFLFLIALGLWSLDLLWVADVQAIPFTSRSAVDVFLTDQFGNPGGAGAGGVKVGPPDAPLIDLSFSEVLITNKTLFGVSSLTAFVNTDGGLFTQGVAQVDTLLSPVGLAPLSEASGHASLQVEFTSGDSPLELELFGVFHRSGPKAPLTAGRADFFCDGFFDPVCMGFGGFAAFYDGSQVGDFPFEFHTILPPGGHKFGFFILAENNLFSNNDTQETTSESRMVWTLQVRPVPMPPTLLLFGLGIIGLAVANGRRSRR